MLNRMIEILDDIFHSDFDGDYESGLRDFAERLFAKGVTCNVGDTEAEAVLTGDDDNV